MINANTVSAHAGEGRVAVSRAMVELAAFRLMDSGEGDPGEGARGRERDAMVGQRSTFGMQTLCAER